MGDVTRSLGGLPCVFCILVRRCPVLARCHHVREQIVLLGIRSAKCSLEEFTKEHDTEPATDRGGRTCFLALPHDWDMRAHGCSSTMWSTVVICLCTDNQKK